MVKYQVFILAIIIGCAPIKSKILKDGVTKVPSDPEFFNTHYRNKFKVSLANDIDTDAVYIERYYVDNQGKLFEQAKTRDGELLSILKFYQNGCVNKFFIKNNDLQNLPLLDPTIMGYRGINFINKDQHMVDLVVPVNELYTLGIKSLKIKVSGDTIYVDNYKDRGKYIYIKYKTDETSKRYTPDW
jgi:hypothetical protein